MAKRPDPTLQESRFGVFIRQYGDCRTYAWIGTKAEAIRIATAKALDLNLPVKFGQQNDNCIFILDPIPRPEQSLAERSRRSGQELGEVFRAAANGSSVRHFDPPENVSLDQPVPRGRGGPERSLPPDRRGVHVPEEAVHTQAQRPSEHDISRSLPNERTEFDILTGGTHGRV